MTRYLPFPLSHVALEIVQFLLRALVIGPLVLTALGLLVLSTNENAGPPFTVQLFALLDATSRPDDSGTITVRRCIYSEPRVAGHVPLPPLPCKSWREDHFPLDAFNSEAAHAFRTIYGVLVCFSILGLMAFKLLRAVAPPRTKPRIFSG